MNFTKLERLILANQYRILQQLDKNAASLHGQRAEILEQGYSGQYPSLFSGFDDELSFEECEEVVEILSMYRALTAARRVLPDHGGLTPEDVSFPGFDGNNETKQYAYLLFMFEQQKLWAELKGSTLNSHCPMLERYRRMLDQWRTSERPYELTRQDVDRIAGASGHR